MNSDLGRTTHIKSLTSRFYETKHDLPQMQFLLMEGRSHANGWHYVHVGELIWGFLIMACHLDQKEYIRR